MIVNHDEFSKEADAVETEVVKGEQNEVLEEHFVLQLKQEKIQKKPRSKPMPKIVKPTVSKVPVKRISPRIEELARPVINNVLSTLRDKAWILPLVAVDNLRKIIEAEICLNPEEAARVLRRKKRKTKKATRFPTLTKKWAGEITKLDTEASPMLDRNAAVCQYLLAINFVKSILEHQCQTRRKDLREITRVILKRLMSVDEYAGAGNGNNDRATQQLHLLAEIIACWIAEILVEVAEADKEALEAYYKKKEMKKTEVDDEETDSETEYWEQMEQKYETEEKSEDTVGRRENGEKNEDVGDEKVKPEQKPEEDVEKKDEDEEVLEGEKEGNETTETQLGE